jgi:HSP20 family molecular chaperone IbpA
MVRVVTPLEALAQARRGMGTGAGDAGGRNGGAAWAPPMDVIETAEAVRCEIELPGVSRTEEVVVVEDGVLTVSGERKPADHETAGAPRVSERRHGRFQRSMVLPRHVGRGAGQRSACRWRADGPSAQDGAGQVATDPHRRRVKTTAAG